LNQTLCKKTGYLLSTLACVISAQAHADVPFRCVVGSDGGWLCGAKSELSISEATPLSAIQPTIRAQAPAKTTKQHITPQSQESVSAIATSSSATTAPKKSTVTENRDGNKKRTEEEVLMQRESLPKKQKIVAAQNSPAPDNTAQCTLKSTAKSGPVVIPSRNSEATIISADEMEIRERTLFHYSGNVVMSRADQTLSADKIDYNRDSTVLEADGNLVYRETGSELTGDRGVFNQKSDSGVVHNAQYKIDANHSSGEAERAEKLGSYVNRYSNATYTTCDPDNKSWEMAAEEIRMDDLEGWGSAKNAVVRFQGVPIMYTPSWTFPMDERRKSGFLFPSWGYEETGGGLISAPYYWNIAPNRDATITPRVIAKRGLLLDGNYRYLNSESDGELDAGFLPSDDLYKDDRWQLKFAHKGDYQSGLEEPLKYEINYASLSDRNYLSDFGNTLGLASSDTLEQTAKVNYSGERWSAGLLFSDHYSIGKRGKCTISGTENTSYTSERSCTANSGTWSVVNIDGDNEPYRKLPQLDLAWSSESDDDQLNYNVASQFTHFSHDTKITGNRLSITPGANYKYTFLNDSAYLTPSVSVAHSRYDLNSSVNKSPQRTIPTYKLESGIFFERDSENYLQELTPTLTYTYIPDGRDTDLTSELSDFDSTTISAEESELLKTTFVGSDKATHTKQLNAKLSTTFTDQDSDDKVLTASIEQAINFISAEKTASNIVGKLDTDFGSHHTDLELSLDPYDGQDDVVTANYQYNPDNDHIFNIGHSYSRDDKRQYDLSAAWRIGSLWGGSWNMLGRYNYELMDPNSHALEELAGISYDTCCWALRFTRNRYFDGTETFNGADRNKFDTKWFLTLELKGLGNLGKRDSLNKLLSDSIKGYKPED